MRLLIYLVLSIAIHASNARILTYNLWNFDGDDDGREDDIKMVIEAIDPDIIVAQELDGTDGFNALGTDVLDQIEAGVFSGAPFTDQSNTNVDIGLYYKHDIFEFVSTATVNTTSNWGNRDVIEFIMRHISSGVDIHLYGAHLKAGTGSDNEVERAEEAEALRNHLNDLDATDFVFVLGDFNLYDSGEDAWANLTESQTDNDGRLFDPIDEVGNWHDNPAFEEVHTQATRAYYNGQNYGGMDDRFDFILTNAAVLDTSSSDCYYVEGTYTAFGNDGNHFNEAINDGNNAVVSDDIADALVMSSDHLPVYLDIWFDDLVYNDAGIVITEIMPNPAAVSDSYGEWFEIHNTTDSTIDLEGWILKDEGTDNHPITNDAMSVLVAPGEYFVFARNADSTVNGGLVADYEFNGFLLSNSEDEIILLDPTGAIVDEVHYTNGWNFGSGVSMEIHGANVNNNVGDNWYEATLAYGDGDLGTPGTNYDGTMAIGENSTVPNQFRLFPPYPNPFNPVTNITFEVESFLPIIINIFDMTGRRIETINHGGMSPGIHHLKWDAESHASGIYFIQLTNGNFSQFQKAILIK